MFKFFKSTFFDFEFLRVLGSAPFQGSEVSECLEARMQLKEDDPEAWYETWNSWGDQASKLGEEALANGDRVAARWAFIRAANYYRSSEFFLHITPEDPRILTAIQKSAYAHDRGIALLESEVMTFNIPYEKGLELPARLYMPAPETRVPGRIPLILQTGGFDSTGEELYFYGAAGAIPRGYAVLSFDGPGQGLSLRRDKTILRPDWEHVTRKVLDYIFDVLEPENERLELDLDRIAVLGASMGGYFALRAAADPRIKACISCDGFYSLFEVVRSRMPGFFINGWLNGSINDNVFNAVSRFLSKFNFQLKWEFAQSKWCYGVDNPADVMRFMQTMSLRCPTGGEYLDRVRCPVLVTGGEEAIYFEPALNAERIMANLGHLDEADKQLWVGAGPAHGGLQAKISCLSLINQRQFEFLDRQFGIQRFVPCKHI
jgi:pimeloyl-ACP methyl ester carboxylesterase